MQITYRDGGTMEEPGKSRCVKSFPTFVRNRTIPKKDRKGKTLRVSLSFPGFRNEDEISLFRPGFFFGNSLILLGKGAGMETVHGLVIFSHGLESGPWGTKIRRLAEVARAENYEVDSLDYSDTRDPAERIRRLVARKPVENRGKNVLVGSSLGSYVAAIASEHWQPDGLFLLAPAFYIPELPVQEPVPHAGKTVVIHGWRDEIIPAEAAFRYADKFRTELHLFDDEHRLIECLPRIEELFKSFLGGLKTA